MSDAILTLYFQPGANIDPNRFNSIFSTLVTLVIKVAMWMRFQHINNGALSDASINNRNRFNSIFFRWLPSLNKKEYESTITWANLYFLRWIHSFYKNEGDFNFVHFSCTMFSTRRDNQSKSILFNIFYAGYTRFNCRKAISAFKYSGLERRFDQHLKSLQFNIFSLVTLVKQERVRIDH